MEYRFEKGGVRLLLDYKKDTFSEYLPRVGICFELDKTFDEVEYLGYGPSESYVDKHISTWKDYYCFKISENVCNYIKPQEYGSHFGCSYVSIKSENEILNVSGQCSFSARPYTDVQLAKAKHHFELPESVSAAINLDYFMCGVGSNSCGPVLAERFRTPDEGKWNIFLRLGSKG